MAKSQQKQQWGAVSIYMVFIARRLDEISKGGRVNGEEKRKNEPWDSVLSVWGREEKSAKEAEKEEPVNQEVNEEIVLFWKSSEKSVSGRPNGPERSSKMRTQH